MVSRGSGHTWACGYTYTGHGRAGIYSTTYATTGLELRSGHTWACGYTYTGHGRAGIYSTTYATTGLELRSGHTWACGYTYTGHGRAGIYSTTYATTGLELRSGHTWACGYTYTGHGRAGIYSTTYATTGLELRRGVVYISAVACRSPAYVNTHRCYSAARLDKEGASMVGVVVGVAAGALALGALGFFLYRRRTAKSMDPEPPAPPSNGGDRLEHGGGEQHQQRQQDLHACSPMIAGSAGGNVARGPPPADQKVSPLPPPPYEHDDAHRRDALPPAASQQHAAVAAGTKFGEDGTPIPSLLPAPPVGALARPSSEGTSKCRRDNNERRTASAGRGGGDAVEDGNGCGAAAEQSLLPSTTTNPTNDVSTEAWTAEVAGFGVSAEERADGAPSATAPAPAAAPAGRRRTSSGVGYGEAALAAAEELAYHCQIPGVSEAATAVSILIHLVLDNRDLTSSAGVKRCLLIVNMLGRAAKVLGNVSDMTRACWSVHHALFCRSILPDVEASRMWAPCIVLSYVSCLIGGVKDVGTMHCSVGGDTSTEEERVLIKEVRDAVSDLVELIKTFQNKSKLGKVLTSTLFKRRQDELNTVIDRAIGGLNVSVVYRNKYAIMFSMDCVSTAQPAALKLLSCLCHV
ncbi:unnamed protein product [Ectocarpus sp. CCAP 1310/34]|nr:unnamed protein product [Ectocarpus sp. CCAP 1310/34]